MISILRLFFVITMVFSLTETIVLLTNYTNKSGSPNFSAVGAISAWVSHNYFDDNDEFVPKFVKKNDYYIKKKVTYWSDRINLYEIEKEYNLPKGLLHAVMHQESAGNLNAVSHAGAVGPFQFMRATAKDFDLIDDGKDHRRDPKRSAVAAAQYYKKLIKMFDGNLNKAIASYNAGEGRVSRSGGEMSRLPKETQHYVKRVRGLMPLYKDS
jgi:soluble lytic murein transglycosylase-like protein